MEVEHDKIYTSKGIYRGRRIDNDEWIDGALLRLIDDDCWIATKLTGKLNTHSEMTAKVDIYKVVPESIGECIGVLDDDDNWIFEGMEIEVTRHGTDKYLFTIEDIRRLPELMFGSSVTGIKITRDTR